MPKLLISDIIGNISVNTGLNATGMKGRNIYELDAKDLIKLPKSSKLFMLPSRTAVGVEPDSGNFVHTMGAYAVAAFLSPGYTATYSASYLPIGTPAQLPLFSYAAVASYKGSLFTAAIQVDKDIRHNCQYIDMGLVKKNAAKFIKLFPKNRLIPHLTTCALVHGCPNAQNLFLSRFEAPLPSSPSCNASCCGCISFQPRKRCPVSQPRIKFIPKPEELSQVALFHIENTQRPIVSFGQGCEGEPLLQYSVIENAISLIRKSTSRGTIHMNTNGSKPDKLERLIDAGLDSVRISLNSARKGYYLKYYRPRGYKFEDVMRSIRIAKSKGAFVSINYLTMPGFTDSQDEAKSLKALASKYGIDMVQWRNLNYDPLRYFEELNAFTRPEGLIGIKAVISSLRKDLPKVRHGYFNPSL